jgi:hypothetical protein
MSIFRQMAGSIRAKHIQTALGPPVQPNQSVAEASERLMEACADAGYDPMSRISLVLAGSRPVAWIGLDSLDSTLKDVASAADPIPADGMVSADTPLLELAKLFSEESRHFYFVLHESQITGTIHYEDLLGPQFKLCLFALTLELETAALDLALQEPMASWSVLSKGRQEKAVEAYRHRYSQEPDAKRFPFDQLLGCTMFIDKGKILKKRRLIANAPNEIDSVFDKADRVRNSCAHTDPEKDFPGLLLDRLSLQGFICKTEEMIAAIRRQLQRRLRR